MVSEIIKLADMFESQINRDLFDNFSSHQEAKHLANIAGKLKYKSDKINNIESSDKLKEAARLILEAADILKYL